MTLSEWERTVPESVTRDPLWRMRVYRLALFLGDLAWADVTRLTRDVRTRALADQLYRAVGSVSANIAEGYSRSSGLDRVRFFEYAMGSARESRDWYYKARHVLGDDHAERRMAQCAEIVRLLLHIAPKERSRTIREPDAAYELPAASLTSEA